MLKLFQRTRKHVAFRGADRFSADLDRLLCLTNREETLSGKVAFLDFSIQVIGQELAVENTARFLRAGTADSQSGSQWHIPKTACIKTIEDASLSGYNIISRPWKDDRLISAIHSEFIHGNRSDWNHFTGYLYRELGLVVIGNGRHHSTVAKYQDSAVANLTVYSLENSFSSVSTDGTAWYYKKDGVMVSTPCPEYRMALLFELARRRHELSGEFQNPEPEHRPRCVREEFCNMAAICDLLQQKTEKLQVAQNECELLRKQLERHL